MTDKTLLVIAEDSSCFRRWCARNKLDPNSSKVRFVREETKLMGYNGTNALVIVVCNGPKMPKSKVPSISRSANAYAARAEYDRELKRIASLWAGVIDAKRDRGIEVRNDECK